ncbi:MAG: hypothetical protein LAO23_16495 [Acidobacteriia bacterium]|nr:hypothetical protein [Terriglobia bacterium]
MRRIAALFLFSIFVFLPRTATAGLPKAAISIPADQNLAAGLTTTERCALPGKLIVLPPVLFQVAADASPAALFEEQARALQSMPQGSEVWLRVVAESGALTGQETEKQMTERVEALLKAAPLSDHAVRGLIVEIKEPMTAPDLFAFALLRLGVTAKASNARLRLAFVFQPGFVGRHGDLVTRLATYSDMLGMTYSPTWRQEATWIAEQALNKPLILKLDAETSAAATPYLTAALAATGSSVEIVWSEPPDATAADRVCSLNTFLTHYIPGNMFPADSATSPFRIAIEGAEKEGAGKEAAGNAEHHWFGGGESPDQVIVAQVNASPDHPKTVRLQTAATEPEQLEIQWYDPATGARLPAGEPVKTGKGFAQTCACTSEHALIYIHKRGDADKTVYSSVEVKGGVELKVEEIIARWQQYREAQKQKLENYRASSFMNLHFESTSLGPGFDISMQLKLFFNRAGQMEIAQNELYVNGVKFGKNHEFPLPQIEPEKVLTQPLELKLNERYKYKLLGTEQVNGVLCYVVGVEPLAADENLYSGKIWIDGTTFREVRQTLSQRGSKSNVLVNVETQNFELVRDDKGNQFNLLRSISAQQLLNAAGRDFVLQRTVQFSDYIINTPLFAYDLDAEHSSKHPMYRETDQGLRSLKKEGNERVLVEKKETRITSLVGGAMYEGTYNFPIPFAGISIADFNFRNTGAQLSTFFAGPILVADLSKQYRPKFRLAVDLALSGLPGENRIYSGNTELKAGDIWTWGETTGLRASWQATTHLSLTASTYLSYQFFRRTSDADKLYVLPRNGVTLLPGIDIKYTRKGYVFSAHGTRGERINWRRFGCTLSTTPPFVCSSSATQPPQSAYTLYHADFNKDYYIGKFTKGGYDFSYYGGNQLDRFSRYFPFFFSEPRIHGIPSGTDSFDAIAMGYVHYGFNVMDLIKIDGLYSYARARVLEETKSGNFQFGNFRRFDGVEVNFNTPGPQGTLIQGTVSYALNGNIPRYNSRWGAYLFIFKPLHF